MALDFGRNEKFNIRHRLWYDMERTLITWPED
jgi:hypothetical protein